MASHAPARGFALCAPLAMVAAAAAQQQQFVPFQFATQQLVSQPIPTGGLDAYPLTGDIDGDGRNDLVIISNWGLSVDYAVGDGSYNVTLTPNVIQTSNSFCGAKLVDFDGDGALDLLALDNSDLKVFRNQGGVLQLVQTVSIGNRPFVVDPMRIADVDGDGDQDVLVIPLGTLMLLRCVGGTFQPPTVAVSGLIWRAVDVFDADGDGDLDLLLGSSTSIIVLANDGTGAFTQVATVVSTINTYLSSFGLLDFEGDGDLDILAPNAGVFRNNGNLSFTNITSTSLPRYYDISSVSSVRCADFDGDGRTDAFLPGVRAAGAPITQLSGVLLHNNGDGTFADVTARVPLTYVGGLLDIGDVDDDGDPDLLSLQHLSALPFRFVLANHLRQCVAATPLQLGQTARFDVSSRPGFALPGSSWLAAALGPVVRPFGLPGIEGRVLIDPTDPMIVGVASHGAGSTGIDQVFVGVPPAAYLLGLHVWFEAMVIPDPGVPGLPGLSNAVSGVIGP